MRKTLQAIALAMIAMTAACSTERPLSLDVRCAVAMPRMAWTAPTQLRERVIVGDVALAVSANGEALAAWLESSGVLDIVTVQTLRYERSSVFGFRPPVWAATPIQVGAFSVARGPQGFGLQPPRVAMDRNGNAAVLWSQPIDVLTSSIQAAHFRNGLWGSQRAVDPGPLVPDRAHSVTDVSAGMDAAGNVIAIWRRQAQGQPELADVFGARFDHAANTWGPASRVSNVGFLNDVEALSVAVDAAGRAVAVWQQPVSLTIGINRFVPGVGWGAPETGFQTQGQSLHSPSISNDATGHATTAWLSADARAQGVNSIQLAALDLTLPPRLSPTTVQGFVRSPRVALSVDASGNAVAAWSQAPAQGFNSGVFARTLSAGGTLIPAFTSPPARLDAGSAPSSGVSVGMGTVGHAVAVWLQHDGTAPSIHANHLLHAPASRGCPENWNWGQPQTIESHATEALAPVSRVFPSGAAVVLWLEQRAPGDPVKRLYAAAYR